MSTKVDLKNLVQLIVDQKNLDANLILDEGCYLQVEDKTPLVKILNYFLNYLTGITKQPMEISLDLMSNSILLMLMAFTDKDDFSDISPNLKDALLQYNGKFELANKPGNWVQIKLNFSL